MEKNEIMRKCETMIVNYRCPKCNNSDMIGTGLKYEGGTDEPVSNGEYEKYICHNCEHIEFLTRKYPMIVYIYDLAEGVNTKAQYIKPLN